MIMWSESRWKSSSIEFSGILISAQWLLMKVGVKRKMKWYKSVWKDEGRWLELWQYFYPTLLIKIIVNLSLSNLGSIPTRHIIIQTESKFIDEQKYWLIIYVNIWKPKLFIFSASLISLAVGINRMISTASTSIH